MPEKFVVSNYDREDPIAIIKEAFKGALNKILVQQEKENDSRQLVFFDQVI
jgi:hypothetical protein